MIDISFEWTSFRSYEISKRGGRKWIHPVGRKADRIAPLKLEPKTPLYLRFAGLDGSEEACLQFARVWGLLHTESPTGSEMLESWQEQIKAMRKEIAFLASDQSRKLDKNNAWKLTSLNVLLVPRPSLVSSDSGSLAMVVQPTNLVDAMRLQHATVLADGGSVRTCKQCGEDFETGASESRRSIAVFCSEKCKNRFHYLERAKR
jgi:hypothetical protein